MYKLRLCLAAKLSLEASAQMPSTCKDCLIHARQRGRESGSQSEDVSALEALTRDSGSWVEGLEETQTDPASWGTTPVWATRGTLTPTLPLILSTSPEIALSSKREEKHSSSRSTNPVEAHPRRAPWGPASN